MLRSREDGECIEGVGKDVVVFALVFGLVAHVFFGSDPTAERRFAFQVLLT